MQHTLVAPRQRCTHQLDALVCHTAGVHQKVICVMHKVRPAKRRVRAEVLIRVQRQYVIGFAAC